MTGSGHPTASFVYKLVAIADGPGTDDALRPVAKRSPGKISVGGRKRAWRRFDGSGHAVAEHVEVVDAGWSDEATAAGEGRALQVRAVADGRRLHQPSADDVRAHHVAARRELRPLHRMIVAAEPAFVAEPVNPRSAP